MMQISSKVIENSLCTVKSDALPAIYLSFSIIFFVLALAASVCDAGWLQVHAFTGKNDFVTMTGPDSIFFNWDYLSSFVGRLVTTIFGGLFA